MAANWSLGEAEPSSGVVLNLVCERVHFHTGMPVSCSPVTPRYASRIVLPPLSGSCRCQARPELVMVRLRPECPRVSFKEPVTLFHSSTWAGAGLAACCDRPVQALPLLAFVFCFVNLLFCFVNWMWLGGCGLQVHRPLSAVYSQVLCSYSPAGVRSPLPPGSTVLILKCT